MAKLGGGTAANGAVQRPTLLSSRRTLVLDIWVMTSEGSGAACPYTNTDLCGTVTTVKLEADQFEVDLEHLPRMV
jgi:hypothetical protein